jgi:hypothetical protein
MNLKEGLLALGTVAVAGLVIAGQTIGWEKVLGPIASRPKIESSSRNRPFTKTFLAEEKIRFKLNTVDTDRVYWLFDESDPFVRGSVEVEHSFRFDEKTPEGIERVRRVDAFYKEGDTYGHASARVQVTNVRVASASIESQGLKLAVATDLKGKWKFSSISLVKYDGGMFSGMSKERPSLATTGNEISAVWDFRQIAAAFTYDSAEEAKNRLGHDNTAWVSIAYEPVGGGQPLTLVKPIQNQAP